MIKETSMMSAVLWNQLQFASISLKLITILLRLLITAEKCFYLLFCFFVSRFLLQGDVMKDFLSHIDSNTEIKAKIDTLRGEVESFARSFPMPGFDNHWMTWKWEYEIYLFSSTPLPVTCVTPLILWRSELLIFRELKSFKIVMNETETILI